MSHFTCRDWEKLLSSELQRQVAEIRTETGGRVLITEVSPDGRHARAVFLPDETNWKVSEPGSWASVVEDTPFRLEDQTQPTLPAIDVDVAGPRH